MAPYEVTDNSSRTIVLEPSWKTWIEFWASSLLLAIVGVWSINQHMEDLCFSAFQIKIYNYEHVEVLKINVNVQFNGTRK